MPAFSFPFFYFLSLTFLPHTFVPSWQNTRSTMQRKHIISYGGCLFPVIHFFLSPAELQTFSEADPRKPRITEQGNSISDSVVSDTIHHDFFDMLRWQRQTRKQCFSTGASKSQSISAAELFSHFLLCHDMCYILKEFSPLKPESCGYPLLFCVWICMVCQYFAHCHFLWIPMDRYVSSVPTFRLFLSKSWSSVRFSCRQTISPIQAALFRDKTQVFWISTKQLKACVSLSWSRLILQIYRMLHDCTKELQNA